MIKRSGPPSQPWGTFLRNHAPDIAAMDLFVAPTLDGLKFVGICSWPKAIHQGHGQVQPIVDERATPQQREAMLRIMSGLDTEPARGV
jgi:Protein of unknown function (DUF1326)